MLFLGECNLFSFSFLDPGSTIFRTVINGSAVNFLWRLGSLAEALKSKERLHSILGQLFSLSKKLVIATPWQVGMIRKSAANMEPRICGEILYKLMHMRFFLVGVVLSFFFFIHSWTQAPQCFGPSLRACSHLSA